VVNMQRAEYIQTIKQALDREDRAEVRRLIALKADAEVAERAEAALAALPMPAIKDGYYTVQLADGHVTLRVERQSDDAKFAPGAQVVARLIGSNNEGDYKGVAFVQPNGRLSVWTKHRQDARLGRALQVLAGDPKAAALGFARASGRCYICGRLLTEPESLDRGIGPVCASKGY
jgi:hypothetical protein